MNTSIVTRFKTGEKCIKDGFFEFDRYTDGTTLPSPTPEEKEIRLTKGETFPPIKSSEKGCWWNLIN